MSRPAPASWRPVHGRGPSRRPLQRHRQLRIRRAELVDVTDADPAVVDRRTTAAGRTRYRTRCDYTRPRPCPNLKNETIAAPAPIAGHRTLLLRITDAGGETTVSAPFSVQARGPLNGANGGDGARLVAGFPARVFRGKGKKRHAVFVLRPSRTVPFGKEATVRGTLKGADGQPVIAADVRILVREARLGAQYVDRGGVTTAADGRFQFPVPAGSSRVLRLAYRAYTGDDAFVTRSTSTLNVPRPDPRQRPQARALARHREVQRAPRRPPVPATRSDARPADLPAGRRLARVRTPHAPARAGPSPSATTSSGRARAASPSASACVPTTPTRTRAESAAGYAFAWDDRARLALQVWVVSRDSTCPRRGRPVCIRLLRRTRTRSLRRVHFPPRHAVVGWGLRRLEVRCAAGHHDRPRRREVERQATPRPATTAQYRP